MTKSHYEIHFTRQASKSIGRLPKDVLKRVDRAILALADNPRPSGSIKLAGYEDLYRIRVGDWRVIYTIEDARLIVLVIEIGPRGRVYRDL